MFPPTTNSRIDAPALVEQDPRWAKIVARDRSADGSFYYSVSTTGVYCRPSCASRAANPRNVRFHDSNEAAQAAGFRPCKRCKPDQPSASIRYAMMVTRICRMIEQADEPLRLATLAKAAGLSAGHFQRIFKTITGVTPNNYAAACRANKVRDELSRGRRVTDALYAAGYSSSGRFYEGSTARFGMKPGDYRRGGANAVISFAIGDSSLGSILVACTSKGICAILIGDDPDKLIGDLRARFSQATLIGGESEFEKTVAKVIDFVEAPGSAIDLPLDIRGTAFQQRVWEALGDIPVGSTVAYQDIAKQIGAPEAARAVANACAANMLAVAIPCHRAVRKNGSMSKYRWGVDRKRILLEREAGD